MIQFIEYGEINDGVKIYARIDEDELIRYTCTEDDSEYQAWLNSKAEQSTPSLENGTIS